MAKLKLPLARKSPREKYLLKKYGITEEQYQELLKKQNYSCAICEKHHTLEKRSLAVEHDHRTGEIFGLCCSWCNQRLLGRIRNPWLFQRASEYLQKGTGWFVPKKKKKRKKKHGNSRRR